MASKGNVLSQGNTENKIRLMFLGGERRAIKIARVVHGRRSSVVCEDMKLIRGRSFLLQEPFDGTHLFLVRIL
jgi:hypothetical protein